MDTLQLVSRPLDQEYEQYARLITKVVYLFRQRFGGEHAELLANANLLFVEACRTWRPELGPLSKRIAHRVWHGLLDKVRQEAKNRKRLKQVSHDLRNVVETELRDWRDLVQGLPEETIELVKLCLEPPSEIIQDLNTTKVENIDPNRYRHAICEFAKEAGMVFDQIKRSLFELAEALK
jgi:hypothetical protein